MKRNRKKLASEWFYRERLRDEQLLPPRSVTGDELPPELKAMRALEQDPDTRFLSREALFLLQGRMTERYEDDYFYPRDVVHYFPTYQSLTDRELRGYFAWRSAWRRGERNRTSLSYAFLYIYELLNLIGASDPMDGYEKLSSFRTDYGALDGKILPYLRNWLSDFVIYYRLDPVLLEGTEEYSFDRAVLVLRESETRKTQEITDAAAALSSYRIDRSRLFLNEPALFSDVLSGVLRRMSGYYAKNRRQSFIDDYIAPLVLQPVSLFGSAVFCDPLRQRSFDVEIDPLRRYRCENGQWTLLCLDSDGSRSRKLGLLLRTTDSRLRTALAYDRQIQPGLSTKWILKIIDEQIASALERRRAAEAASVVIDRTKLDGIRFDAEMTRDRLITEEEEAAASAGQPAREPEPPPAVTSALPVSADPAELSGDELRLLKSLLTGGSTDWVQKKGLLLSVLIDGINDRLFALFGDNVILTDEEPSPVEDYVADLRRLAGL